ncbi:hypothetical protein, partial [Streptomyces viridochromogenes]|uniref:hypothetical protein n=1 Tax=Streptomyces viridochromogenes TaxID=1938 RepID=UPI001F43E71A
TGIRCCSLRHRSHVPQHSIVDGRPGVKECDGRSHGTAHDQLREPQTGSSGPSSIGIRADD